MGVGQTRQREDTIRASCIRRFIGDWLGFAQQRRHYAVDNEHVIGVNGRSSDATGRAHSAFLKLCGL